MNYAFLAAAGDIIKQSAGTACGNSCGGSDLTSIFGKIANSLTFIVGAVAVIMIIIGGLRYVLANGDAKAAAEAKNTIMYAVIGVVVAIAAYAIVSFVTKSVG